MKNPISSFKITNLSVFLISLQKNFKNHPNMAKKSIIFSSYRVGCGNTWRGAWATGGGFVERDIRRGLQKTRGGLEETLKV